MSVRRASGPRFQPPPAAGGGFEALLRKARGCCSGDGPERTVKASPDAAPTGPDDGAATQMVQGVGARSEDGHDRDGRRRDPPPEPNGPAPVIDRTAENRAAVRNGQQATSAARADVRLSHAFRNETRMRQLRAADDPRGCEDRR